MDNPWSIGYDSEMNISAAAQLYFKTNHKKAEKKNFPNTSEGIWSQIGKLIEITEGYHIVHEVIETIVQYGFFVENEFFAKHIGDAKHHPVQIRQ